MLLLACTLLAQLPDNFLPETGGFDHHVVQPFEHQLEILTRKRGPIVRHSCRKDYPP